MNRLGIAILLLTIIIAASCQTQKKPTRKNVVITDAKHYGPATVDTLAGKIPPPPTVLEKPVITPPPAAGNTAEIAAAIMPLLEKQVAFKTFSGKAKMHFKGLGQNHEFSANIRIKKDRAIWVNVTALGGFLPVARILITPDSFQLINNLQKEAIKLPIADAVKVLPVPADFAMLQNLLIGNALKTTGKPVSASDQGGSLKLQVTTGNLVQEVTYNKADSNLRSLQMRTDDNRMEGMVQYDNYGEVSGRQFASSRAVNLNNAGEPYYLDMNFNNAEFDVEIDLPFSVPKSYTLK